MSAPAAVTTADVRVDDPTDPVPSFIASPDTFRDAFLRRVEVTIAKHIDDCRLGRRSQICLARFQSITQFFRLRQHGRFQAGK